MGMNLKVNVRKSKLHHYADFSEMTAESDTVKSW